MTRVHVVGHSLGGKVAAVAALHLAEEEEERLKESRGSDLGDKGKDKDKERIIEIMSLTLIDVSPVDYAGDEAFGEVFRTLDIVEVLNEQLPFIGTEPLSDDGSTPSSGGDRERARDKAADRAGPHARNMLSSLLGARVEDPMLKAFLLASIQPIDRRNKIEVGAMAVDGGDLGGLGSSIRDVMNKIQSTKKLHHPHKVALGLGIGLGVGVGQISGAGESGSNSSNRASGSGSGSIGGFEWKFSVEGIARFREQLGGWPTRYSNDDDDNDDHDNAEAGSIESDLRAAASKNDQRKRSRAVDILQEGGEGEGTSVSAVSTVTVTPYTNPVLVMKGALSKFVKSSHIAPIATLFPLFTLLTVRDAGHWLHFEKPKESSESLIKFIRRVEDRHREINNSKT